MNAHAPNEGRRLGLDLGSNCPSAVQVSFFAAAFGYLLGHEHELHVRHAGLCRGSSLIRRLWTVVSTEPV